MVVNDFHILRSGVGPAEADAVLVVDSDAVLSCPISGQWFESIPRRRSEVLQFFGLVELVELSLGHAPELRRTCLRRSLRACVVEDIAGARVAEGADHTAA